jgi:hypothetical protein
LFIATYDAFICKEVNYEIRKANELEKKIIPCKHARVEWSKVEKIRIYTQGISFEGTDELIREILPRLEKELGVVVSTRPQDNNDTAERHEMIIPSKSNWWRIREIEQHLEDASNLEEEVFSNPAYIIGWMFRVQSSVKEMFGETSLYHQRLPKIPLREIADASVGYANHIKRFRKAKEHLRAILKEIRKADDNNNSKH